MTPFQLEKSFVEFLIKVRSFCCDRTHFGTPKYAGPGHFDGSFSRLLRSKSGFKAEEIHRYIDDQDHGLFHAICVGFAGWVLSGKPAITREFAADFILHDFLRGATGSSVDHDANLRNEFPTLSEVVFYHSNPRLEDRNHPLVLGDRTELRRFSDFDRWADRTIIPAEEPPLFDVFYNSIRPALFELWHHRYECFVGHGPEGKGFIDYAKMWPNFRSLEGDMKTASCEVDKPPFRKCGQHGGDSSWGMVRAWRRLKSREMLCSTIPDRDHLSLNHQSPGSDFVWVFSLSKRTRKRYDDAISASVPVVTRRLVNQFFLTSDLLAERLLMTNLVV